MEADYELIDNEERRQYEFHVEKYTPKIEYMKSTNGEIYLTHTEVPTQLGGKGIGSQLVEKALKEEGIETLIYHIPNVPLQDCIACGSCAKTGKCVFDDCVNEFANR